MTRRSLKSALGLVALLTVLLVSTAGAVEMTIAGMGATNVVSGTAQINVTAPGAQGGYVILRVDGGYVAAQGEPYNFTWNTREAEDGQHEVSVSEVNADGETVDRATEVVRVQNLANVTGAVTLAYQFAEGDELTYDITGETDVRELEQDQLHELVPWTLYSSLAGTLVASSTAKVLSVQDGSATIERTLTEGTVDLPEVISRLAGVGPKTQLIVSPTGALKDGGTVNAAAKFGAPWIGLPPGAVQAGATWEGPMIVQFEIQDGATQVVVAQHELVEFVREGGADCALIKSTFRDKRDLQIRIYGEDRDLLEVYLSGERLTYLSIADGRILRSEDKLRGEVAIKPGEFGVYTMPAGPTVPGATVTRRTIPEVLNVLLSLELTAQLTQ